MFEQVDAWVPVLSAVAGSALTGIGMMVAGLLKSKSDTKVGLTQAQAQMLQDAWAQVNAQRERIELLDRKILEERKACDAQLDDLRAQVRELHQRMED